LTLKEIPLAETGMFPKIVLDYLAGNDFLKQFYKYSPDLNSFGDAIKNRRFTSQSRENLVSVLLDQYSSIGITDEKILSNIHSLKSENAFTVTTGHQLCVFTGPLYFIYKILTTIKLAEELKMKYPENHFVPVFWLASEDHDFEEINHIHLFNKTFIWQTDPNNQPVGKISTHSLSVFINEIKTLFPNSEHLPALLLLFEEEYLKSENISIATRKIVHALFSKYGLIMIEPDDVRLKKSFTKVMLDDIVEQKSFAAINQTNSVLEQEYKLQIHGREINFFYLSEQGRHLIKKVDSNFIVANTDIKFSENEIKNEIGNHPERFSPNVVLRPVYQEMILPNLAYIGGPGEISYWLQLKNVFEVHEVDFPILWLRNSFMLLNKKLQNRIEKTGLDFLDFFQSTEKLSKKFLEKVAGFDTNEISNSIDEKFQQMIDELKKIDNQLASKLIKYKNEQIAFFNKLKKEINEKLKEKSEQDLAKVIKLKEVLFPDGTPQERFENYFQYDSNFPTILIQHVFDNLELTTLFKILSI